MEQHLDNDIDNDLDNDIDNDLDLDNSWVNDYKDIEKNYNDFYNEKVNVIKVFFIFINNEKTVVNIKQEIHPLNVPSKVTREQLITLIKEKQYTNNIKYKLFSIVRYNIDLRPDEINKFVSVSDPVSVSVSDPVSENDPVSVSDPLSVSNTCYNSRFLTVEEKMNDIFFTDTISIFQDLNSLYIIFKEDDNLKINKHFTKKIKKYIKRLQTRTKH